MSIYYMNELLDVISRSWFPSAEVQCPGCKDLSGCLCASDSSRRFATEWRYWRCFSLPFRVAAEPFLAWQNAWRKGPLTSSAPAGVSKLMQWWRNLKFAQPSQESRGTKDELLLKACTGGRVGEKWQSKAFRHLICSQHSCGKRARESHSWANL